MSRFFDGVPPLVFAHRGGCRLGPENTLLAFDIGAATGADGLELDVHLARDGVPVVHHDDTLERTTDASGPLVRLTSVELARVDAAYHFAPERGYPHRGSGVGVPRLREVLVRYPATRIIIEMKVDTEQMGRTVAAEIREAGAESRVCVAGFGARALAAARRELPGVASSAGGREVRWALYRSWCRWPLRRSAYAAFQVPEEASGHRIVTPRFVRDAHRAGLQVHVWTVDHEADMQRLLSWGVDALISNRPDVAVRVRDARESPS